MSISAQIERITDVPEGIRLELYPAKIQGHYEGPGQPYLTILNPTWEPEVGMEIWGGSDLVIIEANPPRQYRRVGYTQLKEANHEQ